MSEDSAGAPDKTGRAYGRAPASYDKVLAEAGPATPGGELLRRYWQPFALSAELNNDLPLPIRILGEDLVAFRDGSGKPGLMYLRCLHRGANLVFGKLEREGIRCPYHGWMYDTEGHLLDTPCEFDPGNPRIRRVIRQPWYPVIERHGIAFTYMGPPDREPLFPRFPAVLEDLAEDEQILASGGSALPTDHGNRLDKGAMDYNWMQYFENFMDPLHLGAIHCMINGRQFTDEIGANPSPCKFRKSPDDTGLTWIGQWRAEGASTFCQVVFQSILPNIKVSSTFIAGVGALTWIVPRDDFSFRVFTLSRARKGPRPMPALAFLHPDWGPTAKKRPYVDWTFEDLQRWQTDYSTQKSLGPVTLHSDEHLTSADAGVIMLRRMFKQQVAWVAAGQDPIGSTPGVATVFDVVAGRADFDVGTGELLEGMARLTLKDYD